MADARADAAPGIAPGADVAPVQLGELLTGLHGVVTAQADALDREDFEAIGRLSTERDRLVAGLGRYRAGDLRPVDRDFLEQIAALDQRLLASARQSLERATRELRSIFRGHGALRRYRERGQAASGAPARLDLAG
jgi:hypothetical protein